MSLFLKSELVSKGKSASFSKKRSATNILFSESQINYEMPNYDIFLSHSYKDFGPESEINDVFLGLKRILEGFGYNVFIDWINAPELNRSRINERTAEKLKRIMKNSKCLLYIPSENSNESKWMPWEMGYMDGITGKVAICPISETDTIEYNGIEYLGLYPHMQIHDDINHHRRLYLARRILHYSYLTFEEWLYQGREI